MHAMPTVKHINQIASDNLSDSLGIGRDEEGRLFVFEGPDGVGKTTLAAMLSQHFSNSAVPNEVLSFPGREPGTVSELIYRLYHDPAALGVKSLVPVTMQVLLTAAHIEVIEARIKPLLRSGVHVILDRFWWSTWVYATFGHVPDKMRDLMVDLELQSWADIKPETIFLVLSHEPLVAEAANQSWRELVRLYMQISNQQRASGPVQLIMNDGTPSDAFGRIISKITQA